MRFTAVLALTSGFIAAPMMAAGNASADPVSCDGAGCVPYVTHDVVGGAHCTGRSRYAFGLDSSGNTFQCASVDKWAPSKPLIGVRPLRAPCDGSGGAAQSPDGVPMTCDGQAWNADYSVIYYTPAT